MNVCSSKPVHILVNVLVYLYYTYSVYIVYDKYILYIYIYIYIIFYIYIYTIYYILYTIYYSIYSKLYLQYTRVGLGPNQGRAICDMEEANLVDPSTKSKGALVAWHNDTMDSTTL